MSIEDPNILKRLKEIEQRLDKLEERITLIESRLGRFPPRPSPRPEPIYPPRPPGPPGPPPEPFRFKKTK
ncbi:MAG: hypothetical protein ACFFFT_13235 [Candidatus Thorarchaeota archaeon]